LLAGIDGRPMSRDMIGRWLRRLEERRLADERRRAAEAEAKAERRKQPAEGDPTDLLSALNPASVVSYDSLGQAHPRLIAMRGRRYPPVLVRVAPASSTCPAPWWPCAARRTSIHGGASED
jgi:hypothetical protein